MIAFILSMPGKGSWNNQWSGEDKLYVEFRKDNQVSKEYIGQSFTYRWSDGWVASITVKQIDSKEATKMKRKSAGFCQYDWMIDSIIDHGKIIIPEDFIEKHGTDEQKYILKICQLIGVSEHNKDYTELKEFHINLSDIETLVENNILNLCDELYDGGPTLVDILKFMTKYKEELYTVTAKVKNKNFTFMSMYKNTFDKIICQESTDELDKLLKNAPCIDYMYDGHTKLYKFI